MEPQITLAPPQADFVLVVSASWWIWAGFALLLVLIVLAMATRKPKP